MPHAVTASAALCVVHVIAVEIRWCAQVVLLFVHVQPESCCGVLVAGSVQV